jgi:hypothetical protein
LRSRRIQGRHDERARHNAGEGDGYRNFQNGVTVHIGPPVEKIGAASRKGRATSILFDLITEDGHLMTFDFAR